MNLGYLLVLYAENERIRRVQVCLVGVVVGQEVFGDHEVPLCVLLVVLGAYLAESSRHYFRLPSVLRPLCRMNHRCLDDICQQFLNQAGLYV